MRKICNKAPCEDKPTPEEALLLKLIDVIFSKNIEEELPAMIRDIVRQTQSECAKLVLQAKPEDIIASIAAKQHRIDDTLRKDFGGRRPGGLIC